MFVGCKLPHGLVVEHNNETIRLNGTNVGYDADNPWRNGTPPDSEFRASGVGLTEVKGTVEAALLDWVEISGKGDGPVKSGAIFIVDRKSDAQKEAQKLEGSDTGLDGVDPSKDLPKGLATADKAE